MLEEVVAEREGGGGLNVKATPSVTETETKHVSGLFSKSLHIESMSGTGSILRI